jgi:prolyl oligopeptidase
MAEYRKPSPAWEPVLDLDALARGEKENWVWSGVDILEPANVRALIRLSRGGGDAVVVREFDIEKKAFVEPSAGGFILPEAKIRVAWGDVDTLYVGTNYGPESLTPSGYPRIIKAWKRGTKLADAPTVFEGANDDMSVGVSGYFDHGHYYVMLNRAVTFFSGEEFLRRGEQWVKIEKPADADVSTFDGKLLVRLRTDWKVDGKTFKGGSLLAGDLEAYLKGDRNLAVLFEPTERTALASFSQTKNSLAINTLDNVASRAYLMRQVAGQWKKTEIPGGETFLTQSVRGLDANDSDELLIEESGYLTPPTLKLDEANGAPPVTLKQLPAFFDASGLEVRQFEALSRDGTRVPYFQVGKKGLALNGENPTLLYGYGGFQISMRPGYSGEVGRAWLARGGVYVVANIRGGGEFGPSWHFAARKEHRQRAYDDFIAVAEDLQKRKVTSPRRLGILGRSNGGLLMGVMITERPDLFGAVACGSPLLDMKRYSHLPAGASWMDEYGDPDKPEDWAYISKYSPYQNIKAGVKYPPILITTSTMDDRVHPGHARKMAARLEEMGHEVLYYENTEGGHAAAANNEQRAKMAALDYAFLWQQLK